MVSYGAAAILLAVFFWCRLRRRREVLASALLLLYAATFLAAIAYDYLYEARPVDLLPVCYLLPVLLLWILPFKGLTSAPRSRKRLGGAEQAIILLYLAVSVAATLYFGAYLFGSVDLGSLAYARHDVNQGRYVLPPGKVTTLLSLVAPLYFVNLILMFVALRDRWGWPLVLTAAASSLMYPFQIACYFGRDGVLFWSINFVILLIVFKNALRPSMKRALAVGGGVVMAVFALAFVMVSLYRFSPAYSLYAARYGTVGSLLDYLGQQPHNFSVSFNSGVRLPGGLFDGTVGVVTHLVGVPQADQSADLLRQAGLADQANTFGYFLKKLVFNYGRWGTVLLSLGAAWLIRSARRRCVASQWYLDFIVLFALYQIPLNGVFYYRQGVGAQDTAYLLLLVSCELARAFRSRVRRAPARAAAGTPLGGGIQSSRDAASQAGSRAGGR